ncbi:MAG: hypothetical protein M0P31_17100 [Solirubrobacteraceae bacterium]|nr:hypothetical protein [Solirubrobacteraceae bacterium]
MPIARPEFGPSLPDVALPWWRGRSRRFRIAVVVGIALVAAVVATWALTRGRTVTHVVIDGPPQFNVRFDDRIERVDAEPGELLRLRNRPAENRGAETIVYRDGGAAPPDAEPGGPPVSQLMLRMAKVMRGVEASLPAGSAFQIRAAGRGSIGRDVTGWLVRYQFKREGRTWYGVRALLLPNVERPTGRVLDVSLQSQQSPVVPNVRQAGVNGPMRLPFYGVAFGTEAP